MIVAAGRQLSFKLMRRLRVTATGRAGDDPSIAHLRTTVKPCVACGCRRAYVLHTVVVPDFDPAILPPSLRDAFLTKQNGYCTRCGLFQDFNRLSAADFRTLNALGKDVLTTDPTYHVYPPPQAAVDAFNGAHFAKRIGRWREYFGRQPIKPKDVLFVRVWFGAGPQFAAEQFGARISGLDMSETCLRHTSEHLPGFRSLEGMIDGVFEGPFLDSGPYDAIFLFHVLTHAADAPETLRQVRKLLNPGGFAVFINEIERKPGNPFHNIHLSEPQLFMLLHREFARIDRIDDCEDAFVPHASPFTLKTDIPDFVAWV